MPTVTVVEIEIGSNPIPRIGNRFVRFKVHVLVFHTAPQTFYEDIVHLSAFAVHADIKPSLLENVGEGLTGKLGTLVRIEDLRASIGGQRPFQSLDTKVAVHGIGEPP